MKLEFKREEFNKLILSSEIEDSGEYKIEVFKYSPITEFIGDNGEPYNYFVKTGFGGEVVYMSQADIDACKESNNKVIDTLLNVGINKDDKFGMGKPIVRLKLYNNTTNQYVIDSIKYIPILNSKFNYMIQDNNGTCHFVELSNEDIKIFEEDNIRIINKIMQGSLYMRPENLMVEAPDYYDPKDILKNVYGNNHSIISQVSDGAHTFEELYYHRMILFALICKYNKENAWKSWEHADGSMYDGFFIVGLNIGDSYASYHYEAKYWDVFDVKEVPNSPEWDGLIGNDINKIKSLLEVPFQKDETYKEKELSNEEVLDIIKDNFYNIEKSKFLYKRATNEILNMVDEFNASELDIKIRWYTIIFISTKLAGGCIEFIHLDNYKTIMKTNLNSIDNDIKVLELRGPMNGVCLGDGDLEFMLLNAETEMLEHTHQSLENGIEIDAWNKYYPASIPKYKKIN